MRKLVQNTLASDFGLTEMLVNHISVALGKDTVMWGNTLSVVRASLKLGCTLAGGPNTAVQRTFVSFTQRAFTQKKPGRYFVVALSHLLQHMQWGIAASANQRRSGFVVDDLDFAVDVLKFIASMCMGPFFAPLPPKSDSSQILSSCSSLPLASGRSNVAC